MFRSTSISIILLALAICAASPSWCLGQVKVVYLSKNRKVAFSHPLLPSPKSTDEASGHELENPFDPFPDASEIAELDSILAAWDQVFAEQPFNTQEFRCWEYDTLFGPSDPDECKRYSQGALVRTSLHKWSLKETIARDWKGTKSYVASERLAAWAWDGESFATWSDSKPHLVPRESKESEPPLSAVLAFCGDGQARELAQRYWMRVVSRESADERPRIEIRPRLEMDARGWKEITILLALDQTPEAIEIVTDKNHRSIFQFTARTNAWWPDERPLNQMARFRRTLEKFKRSLEEESVE